METLNYIKCPVLGTSCFFLRCLNDKCEIIKESRVGYIISKIPYPNEETIGE